MSKIARQALGFIILALIFLAFVAFSISFGYATMLGKNRPNSLGVEEIYTNPNMYLLGKPLNGSVIAGDQPRNDRYTNIRFSPYGTMELYDESVLFCGNEAEAFNGKTGVLVVVYRRAALRMFHGIACHDLVAVFEVPTPGEGE